MAEKSPTNPRGAGRPRFDGKSEEIVVAKLEYVWALRGPDTLAANFAGIARTTLQRFLVDRPDILKRRDQLRGMTILKALKSINYNLENPNHAEWFLERVMPNEFGTKPAQALPAGPTINVFGDVKVQQFVSQFEEGFKNLLMQNLNPIKYIEGQPIPENQDKSLAPAGLPDPAGNAEDGPAEAGSGPDKPAGDTTGVPGAGEAEHTDEAEIEATQVVDTDTEAETGEAVHLAEDTEGEAPEPPVSGIPDDTGTRSGNGNQAAGPSVAGLASRPVHAIPEAADEPRKDPIYPSLE